MTLVKWISSKWWPIALGCSLAAVAYLRFAEAGDYTRRHWTRIQSEDLKVARLDPQMRYFCVGDWAFDMGGDNEPVGLFEDKITMSDGRARKLCLPPWAKAAGDSEILMSAASPDSGWGAALMTVREPLPSALSSIAKRLERLGWREMPGATAARQQRHALPGAMYEKGRAWLLVSAVSDSNERSTTVLTAGRFQLREEVF